MLRYRRAWHNRIVLTVRDVIPHQSHREQLRWALDTITATALQMSAH